MTICSKIYRVVEVYDKRSLNFYTGFKKFGELYSSDYLKKRRLKEPLMGFVAEAFYKS